jgi:DNA-binding MarR family transcriptional regulator
VGERSADDDAVPQGDLGMLTSILFRALRDELRQAMADAGFDDLNTRHGAILANLRPEGVRASDLSRLAGLHKQIIGNMVDELEGLGYVERVPDPADRRAKLVVPTGHGGRVRPRPTAPDPACPRLPTHVPRARRARHVLLRAPSPEPRAPEPPAAARL